MSGWSPPPDQLARFAADLHSLSPSGRIGLAVSGGPDSMVLLLLAAHARRGDVEVATVDHGLRPEAREEAAAVAAVCAELGVPYHLLTVAVEEGASQQARAREARYLALGTWAEQRGLDAVATAHHADDQAETLLMRLARGSGVAGLAGVRRTRSLRGGVRLIRPLLDWRKDELTALVRSAGVEAVDDPTNRDPRHDRTRARALLSETDWFAADRLARSAGALAQAEDALQWTVDRLAAERLRHEGDGVSLVAGDLPAELQRRLILRAVVLVAPQSPMPRGPEVDAALLRLAAGEKLTLGATLWQGGARWTVRPAPPRRQA